MSVKPLKTVRDDEVAHLKPAVDPSSLSHHNLLDGEFWKRIPAYADVSADEFNHHKFQSRNSITRRTSCSRRCKIWCPSRSMTMWPTAFIARP